MSETYALGDFLEGVDVTLLLGLTFLHVLFEDNQARLEHVQGFKRVDVSVLTSFSKRENVAFVWDAALRTLLEAHIILDIFQRSFVTAHIAI